MSLTFLATPLSIVLSTLFVLMTVCVSWLGWRRSGFSARVGLLEALRVLIVSLVAMTWNQPEWLEQYVPDEQPTLLVLADNSHSMDTRDALDPANPSLTPVTRREWIRPLLDQSTWDIAGGNLNVVIEQFSSTLDQPMAGTDLHWALSTAVKNHENLRGIVLVSDGDWNVGPPPGTAASLLRINNVPVFALPAGSEARLPDLALARFDAPSFGVVSKTMRIPFVLRSSLPRDVQTELKLEVSTGESVTKRVTVPAMGTLEDSLSWRPVQTGDTTLVVSVPAQEDELLPENNHRVIPISIREEAIRVLLIESLPRWEYRYLRNALERDPGVTVSCLLFHPGLSKVGGGKGYIEAFPKTLEELSKYDVVFLGDVGVEDGQLTTEQCRLLKGLVRSQASGLILMPGMRGGHLSLLHTELKELYPVVLDANQPRGWGARTASQFELTETGLRSLLTKLEDAEDDNARLWERLPGFHWYAAATRAKAGTEVLATHKTEVGAYGRIPLLVTKTYGTGKVLFMGTDAAWRWRKGVEDKYHYRFWGQVARWMAYQRSVAQGERMRLFHAPDRPRTDTVVTLNANVMSTGGEPLQQGHVSVQAIAPSGNSETVRLRESDDEWGLFTGSFTPTERGDYRMVLRCRENNSTLATKLAVEGVDRERLGQPARIDVLEEIARVSRGRMVQRDEVDELLAEIQALPEPEPLIRRLRLWCHPAWVAALVLLLGMFWAGRKMVGQV